MSKNNVIEKIRKLLALSVGEGATDAERDLALQRAQEMMLKHNLHEAEVAPEEERRVTEERFARIADETSRYLLEMLVEGSLTKCYYYSHYDKARSYVIVGRPDDIAFVKELHAHVLPQIEGAVIREMKRMDKRAQYAYKYGLNAHYREWCDQYADTSAAAYHQHFKQVSQEALLVDYARSGRQRYEQAGKRGLEDIAVLCGISQTYATDVRPFIRRGELAPAFVDNLGVYRRSFTLSACATVRNRLMEARRKFTDEGGEDAKALVRNEMAAVDSYVDTLNLKHNKSERRYDRQAWESGAEVGKDVSLNVGRSIATGRKQLER